MGAKGGGGGCYLFVCYQLMSFYLINVETIRKQKNGKKNSNLKNVTRPANELLLQKCRNNKKIRECTKNSI